jgi:integrase
MAKMHKSRLLWSQQQRLMEHFVSGTTARTAGVLVGVNKTTAAYYFHRLRQLICQASEDATPFSGEVEVDESYFSGRRKGLRGHRKHELTLERKAYATVEAHESYLALHILPKWQDYRLSEVKTVAVEQWLDSMDYAPATKTKLRNIMSAVYSHGIRHEWITFNPISKGRCSAKRLREPDVLTPSEFQALLRELPLRERAAVMLAGSTGLRRSELFALRWSDVSFFTMEVAVTRSCVRNHFGNTKTEASRKPVPLHDSDCDVLAEWRGASLYKSDDNYDNFLFPSLRMNGTQPLMPDMVLRKIIRPALERAGVTGKTVGWHSFRHSLATNLRSLGVDVKVAQELFRHANSRTTMDLYTHAVSADKRNASRRQVELLLA